MGGGYGERVCVCVRERKRENLSLELNLLLFYNDYKLGRMSLFIWLLKSNNKIIT